MAYTPAQIDQYLARIAHPRSRHAPAPLALLGELVARHICAVPFESLALHYSPHRTLSLDPDALFRKVVVDNRGGYCMELNALFAQLLRSLGFTLYTVAGRVYDAGQWTAWSHMLSIVTVDGHRYAVDIGFGTHEPMCPLPLSPGFDFTQIPPRRGLLEHRRLAEHSDPHQRLWVYSTQEDPAAPWIQRICFSETECFPRDYRLMNHYTMSHPTSYFVQVVLAMRGIPDDADARTVAGILTLHKNEVKRVMAHGQTELLETLTTEAERVEALRKYFDVALTPLEQRSISGMASELRGK